MNTPVDELTERISSEDGPALSALAEVLRTRAEGIARRNPRELPVLFRKLESAARTNPHFTPWALWVEGGTRQLTGHTAGAVRSLERASNLFRRSGDEHTAARVDLARMDAMICQGRHRAARRLGLRALETFRRLDDRPRTVSALLNLGGLEESRDRLYRALELWNEARHIVSDDDDLRRGLLEINLGAGNQALGRFSRAEEHYRQAIAHLDTADARATRLLPLLGLAEIIALRGDPGAALFEILEAETEAASVGDENLLAEARVVRLRIELQLGHVERVAETAAAMVRRCGELGRLDDRARFLAFQALAVGKGAEGDLERSTAIAERALRHDIGPVAAAAFRVDLAAVTGDRSSADLSRDAGILERAGHRIAAERARAAGAERAWAEGDLSEARRLCGMILARRSAAVWPRVRALRILSRIEEREGDVTAALRYLRRVIRIIEGIRGRLASEQDRTAVSARAAEDYERLVSLLLMRGDARSRRQAFEAVARVKSRSLVEILDRRLEVEWEDRPGLMRRWNSLREELSAILATLEGHEGGSERYFESAVERRVRTLAREIEDVEMEVARSSPVLADALGRLPAPPFEFRSGEVLLEVFFAGDDLVVFRLDRRGLRVHLTEGVRRRCLELIDGIRFQISKAAYGRRFLEGAGEILVRQIRSQLGELGAMILAPLSGGAAPSRLWVAPHGALHHVPMAALELGEDPILSLCPVAVVPNSGVLARLLAQRHARPQRLAIAGAGGSHLQEIEREVEAIARRFSKAEVAQSVDGEDFRRFLEECDAVHVAAHGAFQPLIPKGSGLLLADGWFTAFDLLRTRTNVRLMTCAACASGDVSIRDGEEMEGLIRALFASGVRTALLAPGALDDHLAREAAESFYRMVFELGPGEAFRRTLLALREEHPHPALWASFQLYGDTRPWEVEA